MMKFQPRISPSAAKKAIMLKAIVIATAVSNS